MKTKVVHTEADVDAAVEGGSAAGAGSDADVSVGGM